MVKTELLYGIFASIIAGLIILNVPVLSGDFLLSANFKANVESIENENEKTFVKIFNKGMSQAENANAFVYGSNVTLNRIICPEGILTQDTSEYLEVKIERFSTGINCELYLNNVNKFQIDKIVVSADKTPGYTWTLATEFDEFSSQVIIIIILEIAGITISTIIGSKLFKRWFKQRKRIATLKFSEKVLEGQRSDLEKEYTKIRENQIKEYDNTTAEEDKQRLSEIDEMRKELQKNFESVLNEIAVENISDDLMGKFIKKWSVFEQELLKKGKKFNIKFSYMPNAGIKIFRELFERQLVTETDKENFQEIRQFRNRVIHGAFQYTDEELKNMIVSVDRLHRIIKHL